MTVFTDSAEMYGSRLEELTAARGAYQTAQAAKDLEGPVLHQGIDYFKEFSYYDRKAVHNLKYYTWVEQQGKTYEEILEQWNPEFWRDIFDNEIGYFDQLIEDFNKEVGLI
jgi:cysteine synthase